jgi:hypothetical protein
MGHRINEYANYFRGEEYGKQEKIDKNKDLASVHPTDIERNKAASHNARHSRDVSPVRG